MSNIRRARRAGESRRAACVCCGSAQDNGAHRRARRCREIRAIRRCTSCSMNSTSRYARPPRPRARRRIFRRIEIEPENRLVEAALAQIKRRATQRRSRHRESARPNRATSHSRGENTGSARSLPRDINAQPALRNRAAPPAHTHVHAPPRFSVFHLLRFIRTARLNSMGDFFPATRSENSSRNVRRAGRGAASLQQIARAFQGNGRAKISSANAHLAASAFLTQGSPSRFTTTTRERSGFFPSTSSRESFPAKEWDTDRARPGPANHRAQSVPARHLSRPKHSARSA